MVWINQQQPLRVVMIAGEDSGDLIGAQLIKALREVYPRIEVTGIVGPKMRAQGATMWWQMEELAVMGLFEIVRHLPRILRIRKQLIKNCLDSPPDVYIGIDAPDFNLPVEKKLRAKKITTVHYNSPTVWAWRRGRLKNIAKSVDLMLTQFPFEAAFYEQEKIPVRYVGHSLADMIPLEAQQQKHKQTLSIPEQDKLVALLPGSREMELNNLGKVFLQAAKQIKQQFSQKNPDQKIHFVAPMVNQRRAEQFQAMQQQIAPELSVMTMLGDSHTAIGASDVVLLASGTATLEALLLKRPMVVAYKLSPLSYWLGKMLVKIDDFSLPNLLAEKKLVPEFIQHQATADNLAQAVCERLFDSQDRLLHEYEVIHAGLRRNASVQAANAILSLLTLKKTKHRTLEI